MPIPALMSRPTTASPSEAQNSHQMGPKTSARPPTRNAAMISETATQETVRPWKEGKETGVPGTWDTNGTTCSPPAATVPALTAPDPRPATEPLAELAVADPTCFAMRAAPLLPLVVIPTIVVKRGLARTPGPGDDSRRQGAPHTAHRQLAARSGPVRPAGSVSPRISPTMAVAG